MLEGADKTDIELARASITDQREFGHIVNRYEAKLRRYVHRLTNIPDHDVDDVLQEVFLKAYRNLHNVDSAGSFNAWIYRITHNTVISEYRKKKARPPETFIDETQRTTLASELSVSKEVDQRLLTQALGEKIQSLPYKYRDVLILKYIEEKSYEEISDILQKPIGTVATLLSRAKKKLKKSLEESKTFI